MVLCRCWLLGDFQRSLVANQNSASRSVDSQKRIFIVDDHELVRTLLKEYLDMEPDFEVCGSVDSGEEALGRLLQAPQTANGKSSPPALECDLALIDVSIPDMNGIELVRRLNEERPGLRCLIVSGHARAVYAEDALRAGAKGYVMKGDPDLLVEAVRQVLRGETYVDEQIEQQNEVS